MRTQRLQNDWLPIFDGKVLKFLKRHVEVNLNIVVAADANGFDELRNDHFLCLKGAGVEQICPCEQSVVFLSLIHILRPCVPAARKKAEETGAPAAAIELSLIHI